MLIGFGDWVRAIPCTRQPLRAIGLHRPLRICSETPGPLARARSLLIEYPKRIRWPELAMSSKQAKRGHHVVRICPVHGRVHEATAAMGFLVGRIVHARRGIFHLPARGHFAAG